MSVCLFGGYLRMAHSPRGWNASTSACVTQSRVRHACKRNTRHVYNRTMNTRRDIATFDAQMEEGKTPSTGMGLCPLTGGDTLGYSQFPVPKDYCSWESEEERRRKLLLILNTHKNEMKRKNRRQRQTRGKWIDEEKRAQQTKREMQGASYFIDSQGAAIKIKSHPLTSSLQVEPGFSLENEDAGATKNYDCSGRYYRSAPEWQDGHDNSWRNDRLCNTQSMPRLTSKFGQSAKSGPCSSARSVGAELHYQPFFESSRQAPKLLHTPAFTPASCQGEIKPAAGVTAKCGNQVVQGTRRDHVRRRRIQQNGLQVLRRVTPCSVY